MAHLSDFWRLGGVITPELWADGGDTAAIAESIKGDTHQDDDPLPFESMPLAQWLRLPARDMHAATLEWITEAVRRR